MLAATLSWIAWSAVASAATPAPDPEGLTIYRCTDGAGRLTLRDSPCNRGERQETRSMIRPKDAPARAAAPVMAASAEPAPQAAAPTVVYATPPRPMYDCTTPDGDRYVSDSPAGNPRLAAVWTLGTQSPFEAFPGPGLPPPPPGPPPGPPPPVRPPDPPILVARAEASGGYGAGIVDGVIDPGWPLGTGPSTWVRDVCHPMPQGEVCARVRDRLDAVRRRFSMAQPTERAMLTTEERGIQARLAQDCR